MKSDLELKTFKFEIFFSFYFCFREDLDPPPVGFCCLFVFSPCSRSSGISWSFSASIGCYCLLGSFIWLFLCSEAPILLDCGFFLFLSKRSFGKISFSKKVSPQAKSASFFLIFRWFDRDLNSAFGSAGEFDFHNSGGELQHNL